MRKLKIAEISPYYLKDFLIYMSTIKGRSDNTIVSYHSDLKMFLRFLKTGEPPVANGGPPVANIDFNEIDISDLDESLVKSATLNTAMEFFYYMSTERGNSTRARYRRAVALRKFYKFLTDNKMWFTISPMEKLELPNTKKTLPKHLTIEQALKILNSFNNLTNSKADDIKKSRDYFILTLFLNCGLRLSELVGLNTTDIKISRGESSAADFPAPTPEYTIKVLGKGGKERIIYMNNACIAAYEKYINFRERLVAENSKLTHEKALFLSKQNKRISNRRVQQVIEALLKANDLDNMGFSVHKLRHTAATLMYQNGVDVRALQEVLGHESLDTTQIYTHVANEQVRRAIEKNPLNQG